MPCASPPPPLPPVIESVLLGSAPLTLPPASASPHMTCTCLLPSLPPQRLGSAPPPDVPALLMNDVSICRLRYSVQKLPNMDITPNNCTRNVTDSLHWGQVAASRDPHSGGVWLQKMCPHPKDTHPTPIFSKQHAYSSTCSISFTCFRRSSASCTFALASDAIVTS